MGVRCVLTNLFGARKVLAYVTSAVKDGGVWHEKAPLSQTGSDWMQYIPLFLYSFQWNIEVSYYEQKTFWFLCSYMVRNCKGIEMMWCYIIKKQKKQ